MNSGNILEMQSVTVVNVKSKFQSEILGSRHGLLISPPGDSDVHFSLRTTGFFRGKYAVAQGHLAVTDGAGGRA